ncbi:MAG TPA: hypothetical protein VHO06_02335, partial [Polyangia bacterium]|nr:hypothetical protein [Polyangia bacterium]
MRRSSLASPARAIQRKRIHSLSTGGRLAGAAAALLALAGCGAGGGGSGTFALTADLTMAGCDQASRSCKLDPDAQETLTFVLTRGGQPAPGQTVTFAVTGSSPAAGGQAPAVGAPMGVTDGNGAVSVSVRAGTGDFVLEAQFQSLEAQVTMIVVEGSTGTVVVAPFLAPTATPLPADATFQILFYDSTSCGDLNLDQPRDVVRGIVTLNAPGDTARFDLVGTTVVSAAVGRALSDKSAVLATGCVDIPGSSLVAGGTVEVALPLTDAFPDPVGTYTVISTLAFAPPLAASASLGAAWSDLSDCPLDPAELWLDCTVDALSPATAADPLDCVPAAAPGGEGALGDAIAALRGTALADATGAPTGCRSARDAAGDPSL